MPRMGTKTQATTPESTTEDEHCLVPSTQPRATLTKRWQCQYPPPYATLSSSILQLIIYGVATNDIERLFRFDPNNQIEAWRFVTYMFIHRNLFHAILNVVIQCLFAITLERNQKRLLVVILYFGSGVLGALGSSCIRPDLVVGASAGVYGLLTSHLSHIALNYNSSKYKLWTLLTVIIIIASDITYYFIHSTYNNHFIISEGAHVAGAIGGFLLGLLLYQSKDKESKTRNKIIFWSVLTIFLILLSILIVINILIRKCTPVHQIKVHFNYIC